MGEVLQAEGLFPAEAHVALAVEQTIVVEVLDMPMPVAGRPLEPLWIGTWAAQVGISIAGVPARKVKPKQFALPNRRAPLDDGTIRTRECSVIDREVAHERNEICSHVTSLPPVG